MPAGRTNPGRSLASDIVRVTLLIGAAIVIAATIASIVGVSRLAVARVETTTRSELSSIEVGLEEGSQGAARSLDRAAAAVYRAETPEQLKEAVQELQVESSPLIASIAIADTDGEVLASWPPDLSGTDIGERPEFVRARAGTGYYEFDEESGDLSLWLGRTIVTAGGQPLVCVLALSPRYLGELLAEASGALGARSAAIVEPDTDAVVWHDSEGVDVGALRFLAEEVGGGRVSAVGDDQAPMAGFYRDLDGLPGVRWRVLVVRPRAAVWQDTASAVAPSIGVLLLGGLVGLAVSWVLARRVSDPLRTMESAARRAARGAYVKPLRTERDDEIGRVADAFNAVAIRLNSLHDLSQLIARASRLDQVIDGILSAMGHIFGPGVSAVFLLDEAGALVPARVRGADTIDIPSADPAGDGLVARAYATQETMSFEGDPAELAEQLPGMAFESATTAIAAPLLVGYEPLGVVVVVPESGHEFSDAEVEMVRTFSAQAAVAVDNSRLFAVEAESRRVAEVLRSVAEDLVGTRELGFAVGSVSRRVRDLFGAQAVEVALADRSALGLPAASEPEIEEGLVAIGRRLFIEDGTGSLLLARGEDPASDKVLAEMRASELLVLPIGSLSGHGGVLAIAAGPRGFRSRDTEVARAVANELALALDNAFSHQRAVSRAANLETIFRISQAVGSSLQVNVVLNRVLDVVQKIFSADAVALMTLDPVKHVVATAMARGLVSPEILHLELEPGEDIPGFVFESGEPVRVGDMQPQREGLVGAAAGGGLRSLIAVPLLARGRSIGVLMVFSVEQQAFSEEDANVLQTFASQAALAVDTARLYSREHEVASILQASITPEDLPELDDLELSALYLPLGQQAEIGGDFYDAVLAPDGDIVLAIGDVCGKGVVAATKTSMIKYSVRALIGAGLPPAELLAHVNRMVTERGGFGDIVTIWLGKLDRRHATLRWASAGHPAGLLRRAATGRVRRLQPTGPLLGAAADIVYEERSVPVEPGDTLLLYTDGVTEARSGDKFFGERRVRRAVAEGGSADEVGQRLLSALKMFAKGDLRDDVAVLVAKLLGGSDEDRTPEGRETS